MTAARRGMTLMELVVAIALTGMMAAAGAATFASIIDHRRVIRESTVETERAAALREMIRTWIAASTILVQQGGGPRGLASSARISSRPGVATGVTAAAQTGDEISFNTSAITPTPSANTRVRLFVDGDPNTPETGLTMEYQGSNAAPLQRRQLDSTIGLMLVEYLDNRTGRWYPALQAATIRPIALRFAFAAAEGDSIPRLLQLPFVFRMGDVQQQRGR
ncbi:MAG TPA: prepilin-type N-terminal cleavage/methylation domain-containing protein [Gemmatimonadaceae bacterium]|nr:prepilin-type N-terminal cleavage/methylation domain-containing protein [Gemmatimonadaceae bacterium]